MKKWFMENGFEKNGTIYGKSLRMVEDGLMFWIEYDEEYDKLTISKFFKHYDISWVKKFNISKEKDIKKLIHSIIIEMKPYLCFYEYLKLEDEGFFKSSTLDDMKWYMDI